MRELGRQKPHLWKDGEKWVCFYDMVEISSRSKKYSYNRAIQIRKIYEQIREPIK